MTVWRKTFSAALTLIGKKDCNVGRCCQQCALCGACITSCLCWWLYRQLQMTLVLVMLW